MILCTILYNFLDEELFDTEVLTDQNLYKLKLKGDEEELFVFEKIDLEQWELTFFFPVGITEEGKSEFFPVVEIVHEDNFNQRADKTFTTILKAYKGILKYKVIQLQQNEPKNWIVSTSLVLEKIITIEKLLKPLWERL